MTIDASALTLVPTRRELTGLGSTAELRKALDADGAVILTGLPPGPDSMPVAAAMVLGDRLERLFPIRRRAERDGKAVRLHADSFDISVETGSGPQRRRDPDEDYVLIQLEQPPATGGGNFVADAYAFADACAAADPELWRFLTKYDVDLYGTWPDIRGLPATPRVARHVEYTRTGRRIVRRTQGVVPLHREPAAEHVGVMLRRLDAVLDDLEPGLPRLELARGEILVLDNYRCWHGRDPHTGDRTVNILTLRSTQAR
ncbi:MAG: TauD/TfdA family dioxygenase [Stackebrandtia sp.]